MKPSETIRAIAAGELDARFRRVYGDAAEAQKKRYTTAIESFAELYGEDRDISLFSVPGRSEISGNHTDHNGGKVLAAAITLDIVAIAAQSAEPVIRIRSEGYREDRIVIAETTAPKEENKFKSRGLVAGMCAGYVRRGYKVGGFDAYTTSSVHKGSGLSSSAAFEVMVGNIMNYFFNDAKIEAPEIAKIAQFSENEYFGKPCGLMDQTACAVGGFVSIDFENLTAPVIKAVDFDLAAAGYSLCIVNTGGNHADLNEDYASVPAEMKKVAAYFGKDKLRGLTVNDIISNISLLRPTVGDRAIMRAIHFVNENERVEKQTAALEESRLDDFFAGVFASGDSSFKYLQNVYTVKNVAEQGLSLALCVTEQVLRGKKAAWRVHGGGFAGTIQAFVPHAEVEAHRAVIDSVFGEGACCVLCVRGNGATRI